MALTAQRFAGDQTLEDCLSGSHRMTLGDPNPDSVLKVQRALADLGYRPMLIDGLFGDITAGAVKTFKTDQGLSPADPVVGQGTMGALNTIFEGETSTPDDPDASATGLDQEADAAKDLAIKWFDAALGGFQQFPTGQDPSGGDPDFAAFDAALERNFHASTFAPGREVLIRTGLKPVYEGAKRALTLPFVAIVPVDRAGWDADARGAYRPTVFTAGARVIVTPPFRNVLSEDDRALTIAKGALFSSFIDLDIFGLPQMPRYANNGGLALRNVISYAAFGLELFTGGTAFFSPLPVWP